MQVISRSIHEGLVIAGDIHVTVLEIRRDHVRVAISAPRNIPCYWEQDLYLSDADPDSHASDLYACDAYEADAYGADALDTELHEAELFGAGSEFESAYALDEYDESPSSAAVRY